MTENSINDANGPFEGPEKLLEIWFAQSPAHVPDASFPDAQGRTGLRKVPRQTWEDMLSIVRCKVLSVVNGDDIDAYLLRYEFTRRFLLLSLSIIP
jgi:S-adenosylmethionine decarboxylase